MEEELVEPPSYIHIETNDFSYRRHKRQKEEDIAVCECQYDILDPESPCGERCLNVLTNTECTPGYCRCGVYCKNQAGQFVIEYCGEVISWKEANQRSQAYETQGLKDAYIIYLNADESIDATRKGSLARFINHSCQPNCETRKWNVLGEVRVGIFAKQDIPFGTELSYDYNFEWFGGTVVRCLCGATSCSGFLGAKSRGFQEATYLWEDDDDRFSVENIPLYDSADDERTSVSKDILLVSDGPITPYSNNNIVQSADNSGTSSNEFVPMVVEQLTVKENKFTPMTVEPLSASSHEFTPMTIEPLNAIPMGVDFIENGSTEHSTQNTHDVPRNAVCKVENQQSQTESEKNSTHSELFPVKPSPKVPGRKPKRHPRKQMNIPDICDRLASSVAREEILYCEEVKKQATSEIDALYNEIRPAIEEHERDSQDSVSTSLAENWIEASCCKYKADFDLYAAIIKNLASTPLRSKEEQNGLKYLENGP
ncbi:hypothetical protein ACP4OV_011008 [Aristida adscensionis]